MRVRLADLRTRERLPAIPVKLAELRCATCGGGDCWIFVLPRRGRPLGFNSVPCAEKSGWPFLRSEVLAVGEVCDASEAAGA